MAQEIERKFLVTSDEYRGMAERVFEIRQGYLSRVPGRTVRIRIKGEEGYITIKGKSTMSGLSRFEWEKRIEVADAEELLKLCEPGIIEKRRYIVPFKGHTFEVDEFLGALEGRVIAEIELKSLDESFDSPTWLGREVTGDPAYYNSTLSAELG